ncbi:MAG: hypothetical protein ACJAUD_001936, partial [Crocinitomicaceae bacterium]
PDDQAQAFDRESPDDQAQAFDRESPDDQAQAFVENKRSIKHERE